MNLFSIKVSLFVFILLGCFGFTSWSSNYKVNTHSLNLILQDTTKKDSIQSTTLSDSAKNVEQNTSLIETHPNYPDGGMDGFYKYVEKNLVYPKEAKKKKIEGRVFVQFIVDKEGKITDVQTVKGIGGGCDQEAERLLRECKNWIPATHNGKPVKVRLNIPIIFRR